MAVECLENEQVAIVKLVNSEKSKLPQLKNRNRAWNKYVGNKTNIVLMGYLNARIAAGFKAVGPSVFIEHAPTEFDSLVLNWKHNFDNVTVYPRNRVKIAIEVKDRGLFDKKIEVEPKLRKKMENIVQDLQGIPYLYVTFHESEKLIEATRNVLGPNAFFLSTGSEKNLKIITGEWARFITTVNSVLSRA